MRASSSSQHGSGGVEVRRYHLYLGTGTGSGYLIVDCTSLYAIPRYFRDSAGPIIDTARGSAQCNDSGSDICDGSNYWFG